MDTDVLIVGGGLAGLSVADHLTRLGVDFILIEGHNRLGGRILSKEIAGAKFDLGPAWFWRDQARMAALIRRFGLPVFDQYTTGDVIYQDRSGAVQHGGGYASMQGSLRVGGGMASLIAALTDALNEDRILLQTTLSSLSYEKNLIVAIVERIDTINVDQVRARRVVLAVPPRVVANTVAFHPPLDASKIKAMSRIPTWMAGQAKILAVYDEPHWRNAGLSGDAISRQGPMIEIHDASPIEGGPFALFGFVGIPPDTRMTREDEMMRSALIQLSALFGAFMDNPLAMVFKDWAVMPGIATSQDHEPIRNHPNYGLPADLRDLWDSKLYLASTEVGKNFGGFLEGALEAAEATARDVTASMSRAA